MSCTPLPKAAKPVWAKQLTRLPCLVVYVKFQFVYTIKVIKIGAATLMHVLFVQKRTRSLLWPKWEETLGRGAEQRILNVWLDMSKPIASGNRF